MKARTRIDATSYPPDVVHAMGEAFERAWVEIANNFANDPSRVDAARTRLADAVLAAASKHSTNIEALKNGALQVIAQDQGSSVKD